jgi:hypothetical protein
MKPWAYGPFEVLLHGETHYRIGEDPDRRIAMVGFDNSIELSVATYLRLDPMQRCDREYPKDKVEQWLVNFHTKVGFFFEECKARSVIARCKRDEMIWYHSVRNGQYHHAGPTIPQRRELDGVRHAALEVFSILFEEDAIELLEEHMAPPLLPPRTDEHDRLIDSEYDMVKVCGQPEYVSNVLYALDPDRYREVALELKQADADSEDEGLS